MNLKALYYLKFNLGKYTTFEIPKLRKPLKKVRVSVTL